MANQETLSSRDARERELVSVLGSLDEGLEVPEAFSRSWRAAIAQEEASMKQVHRFKWQRVVSVAAALVVMAGGAVMARQISPRTQNAAPAPAMAKYETEESASDAAPMLYMARGAETGASGAYDNGMNDSIAADTAQAREEKIIRTITFTVATQSFDEDITALRALTSQYGGRVESSRVSGDTAKGALRTATLTLRVPSPQTDAFLGGATALGRVTTQSETTKDVSESYYDTKARLETQQAKMQRLTALMGTAAELSDIIELENAIADTQYQIDSYQSALQSVDGRVQDSTITVTVKEETAQQAVTQQAHTLGERIAVAVQVAWEGLLSFLEDAAVFLVLILPLIAVAAIVLIIKKNRKNKKGE